jgi:hypothetical protein
LPQVACPFIPYLTEETQTRIVGPYNWAAQAIIG